ncbi:MAG: hypothetical protein RL245_1139, partial [Pseudomonadota bacterium]
ACWLPPSSSKNGRASSSRRCVEGLAADGADPSGIEREVTPDTLGKCFVQYQGRGSRRPPTPIHAIDEREETLVHGALSEIEQVARDTQPEGRLFAFGGERGVGHVEHSIARAHKFWDGA